MSWLAGRWAYGWLPASKIKDFEGGFQSLAKSKTSKIFIEQVRQAVVPARPSAPAACSCLSFVLGPGNEATGCNAASETYAWLALSTLLLLRACGQVATAVKMCKGFEPEGWDAAAALAGIYLPTYSRCMHMC